MDDVLKYAIENGIIDLSHIQEQIEMQKREEILEKYERKIWFASDEYWKIRIYDDSVKTTRLIKRRNRSDLEDEIIKIHKQAEENPTVREAFDEWNSRNLRLNKISKGTYDRYRQDYNRFYTKEYEISEDGETRMMDKIRIKSMTAEDFRDFLENQLSGEELTQKAFSNLKTITRGMLKRVKRRKLIDWNVEEMFDDLDVSERGFKKIVKEPLEQVFDDAEMERMVNYLKENMDQRNIGIMILFITGIRVGELAALKWEDWSFNKNGASYIKIRREEVRFQDKHGKYIFEIKEFPKTEAGIRNVLIPNGCVWIIQRLRNMTAFNEFMFVENGERLKTFSFRNRLYRVCEKTNCVKKSPHKVRNTYCSILLDHSIDNQMVISQMGHTDISCSEKHYHRDRKTLTKKQQIVDNIAEFKILGSSVNFEQREHTGNQREQLPKS